LLCERGLLCACVSHDVCITWKLGQLYMATVFRLFQQGNYILAAAAGHAFHSQTGGGRIFTYVHPWLTCFPLTNRRGPYIFWSVYATFASTAMSHSHPKPYLVLVPTDEQLICLVPHYLQHGSVCPPDCPPSHTVWVVRDAPEPGIHFDQ
jgi:hypothetical protein